MKVFLSYGREDVHSAERLHDDLVAAGCDVWFDKVSLLPGQKWESTIVRAIRSADTVCALLSQKSVGRRGFVNKELVEALRVVNEMPESRPFLIPVRLDDCEPSYAQLSELHRADMFPDWNEGLRQILKTLEHAGHTLAPNQPFLRAFVQIRLRDATLDSTMRRLTDLPGVVSVEPTLGPFDIMIVVACAGYGELSASMRSIRELETVDETSLHIVIPSPGSA